MPSQSCYPEKAPAIDKLLDTLSNHLRRQVIDYFENHTQSRTASLDELVVYVERQVPSEGHEQLKLNLIHVHLPELAERGWIDYDRQDYQIHYNGHENADRWLREVRSVFL
ncbi:DUF7344 domain-containing protein [Halostella litorea]|uniref:DUF7344 domain-containing protein n=1 Tax=Halostella litorea TaxID=2528831 RepID=UPI001091F878|nr:hypothetical protein [Halostella litorea]